MAKASGPGPQSAPATAAPPTIGANTVATPAVAAAASTVAPVVAPVEAAKADDKPAATDSDADKAKAAALAAEAEANRKLAEDLDRRQKELDAKAAELDQRHESLLKTASELHEKAVAESAGVKPAAVSSGEPAVYRVEIPGCLVGPQFVVATSEAEAVEKYKAPAGITRHREQAVVGCTDLDPTKLPEGVTLYGE